MPTIYAMYIINKSGGLIYNKEFVAMSGVNLNDTLRLASIWHSLHAIASQLSPVPHCTGIELLQADTFDLHCFQTLTGTKFLMITEPQTPDIEETLKSMIYELYVDYVLKNPFYEVEMPIRCELFDTNLALKSTSREVRLQAARALSALAERSGHGSAEPILSEQQCNLMMETALSMLWSERQRDNDAGIAVLAVLARQPYMMQSEAFAGPSHSWIGSGGLLRLLDIVMDRPEADQQGQSQALGQLVLGNFERLSDADRAELLKKMADQFAPTVLDPVKKGVLQPFQQGIQAATSKITVQAVSLAAQAVKGAVANAGRIVASVIVGSLYQGATTIELPSPLRLWAKGNPASSQLVVVIAAAMSLIFMLWAMERPQYVWRRWYERADFGHRPA
ncbi:hypothetical protein WJX72_003556 [[Myrmecia] bisecta]|uniref:Trafficking protein particle complex subunit n=1 Tax=[Myrmecia] bisecta TaxID=41462 RepID=A0AAW1R5I0_9CHLO